MGKKTQPAYMLSTRDSPQHKRSTGLKVKKWKKEIFQVNEHEQKSQGSNNSAVHSTIF